MQNSLIMADFYTNGDERFKKRLMKDQDNFIKADVMLVKENAMLPTILFGPEDKLFLQNCNPKNTYNVKRRKSSKSSKEPEIFISANKLNRKIKSLSFEATVTKSKNLIEEKSSAPIGLQKYTTFTNFLLQPAIQERRKLKSSSSSFVSLTHKLHEEKSISEYNYSQKSLPSKKKVDFGLQITPKNSLNLVQKRTVNKMQNTFSTSNESKAQQTSKYKLESENCKYSEPTKDNNILNIFTLSNDHRSNASLNSYADDSMEQGKENIWKKYSICDNNGDKQKSTKVSNSINKEYTACILKNDRSELDCQIKYSWQDIDNWLAPSQKKEIANTKESSLDCKITYSWQILGIGTQTSRHLLQNFDKNCDNDKCQCTIKYSWQILGKSTQAFLNDYEDHLNLNEDYWRGLILLPRKNYDAWNKIESPRESSKSQNKSRILYCEKTQTLSDNRTQTELTDCRVKYSWENLIQQHLESIKSSKFEASEKISYDKYCVKYLRTRMDPMECSMKYSWQNLISQRLKSKEQEFDVFGYEFDKY